MEMRMKALDLAPVIERQLRGEYGGLAQRAFFEHFAQILGSGAVNLRMPTSSIPGNNHASRGSGS
jgi:hypothetical protein